MTEPMSRTVTAVTEPLAEYVRSVTLREPELLRRLREETAPHPRAQMQVSPEQGQFMSLLVRMIGARKTLEVGVFTGYSSLSVALALPADGRLVACDVSEEYTSIARRYWKEAGVDSKIDLRIAPALESLDRLIKGGEAGSFDFAFIDADKVNYWNYFERVLVLLRPGGVAGIDNVLWHGRLIDANESDPDTLALREFNRRLHTDERVWISMVTIGDGLTLALKR
jgi:caffeoyl-CoA O-methyltransferase